LKFQEDVSYHHCPILFV
jgi:hypothetical protein